MDRRKGGRNSRRIGVRFWEKGEKKERIGHTLNVSPDGMFVGTDRPLQSGARVRVEVTDPEVGFVVEGVVAHSHRVAPELRRIQEPGMGVRFLSHQELVEPLMHQMARNAAEEARGPRTGEPSATFPVRFDSSWQFLRVLEQDIRQGGLFVATSRPAGLNQVIPLELHIPGLDRPIHLSARVVHRFDPVEHGVSTSGERIAGMGVEFIERGAAVEQLEKVAQLLRR